ncbi:MAG: hypothetical protein KAW12_09760 [Candidatus Aminicenantes bacterium]|nr:hypothetical protein [Candidatus Aminicenantes bacterium]
MILPDKNILLSNSLLGMGTDLLDRLKSPQTVSSLWQKARKDSDINAYEKYILTLDFLFILNLIELHEGLLRRVNA